MAPANPKKRADTLLVERGLAESKEQAQALIMAGLVYLPTGQLLKAGSRIANDAPLEVRGRLPFVSRGGVKLAHALDCFGLDVQGLTALDVGASTGGFTDCLLQRGAKRVYAIDVGRGQLHYRLRQDDRVVATERLNARYPYELSGPPGGASAGLVDLAVIDVSFISLSLVIPPALRHLKSGGAPGGGSAGLLKGGSAGSPKGGSAGSLEGGTVGSPEGGTVGSILALVKPQFEVPKGQVGRGGVIRDGKIHAAALSKMINWSVERGLRVRDVCRSPILGDAGNAEFFLLLRKED